MTEGIVPSVPACVDGPAHNFTLRSKNHVFCTKCGANVRFTKPKKDNK